MKLHNKFTLIFVILFMCCLLFSCADTQGGVIDNTLSPSEQINSPDTTEIEPLTVETESNTEPVTEAQTIPEETGPDPWNPDSIIFSYPSSMPASEIYADVKKGGWVVFNGNFIMAGDNIWNEFYEKVSKGEPATVNIAKYYTLDKSTIAPEALPYYEKEYPQIFLTEVIYDGETFKSMTRYSIQNGIESRGEYPYLVKSEETPSSSTAKYGYSVTYFLCDRNDLTYNQIMDSFFLPEYSTIRVSFKTLYNVIYEVKDEYTDMIPKE
ncbi:MAG: hypothetical protein IKK01_04825 [Clostridia bacterium]|nr:hypothetical protein [Clostridia bacterium]